MPTPDQQSLAGLDAPKKPSASAFDAGMHRAIEDLIAEITALYLSDNVPWIVGYSGGKDSTAITQLVWMALARMRPEQRHKPVHVISTDTMVENPIVSLWASKSLESMRVAAAEQGLPIIPHRLTPAIVDSFWVCLIGRGYPAPRPMMRWCTERLKIKPSNAFIESIVLAGGSAILVLGTRKAESAARARVMNRLEADRVRERLSPNASLPGTEVYSPIEDWANDDVWLFLMQHKNPWRWDNKSLLTMYQGATEGGECPLVVDTSTPSCGTSRFGCWTCTMVTQDKSMGAMIQNDREKEWMLPLLELRNALDLEDDRHLRDFRRMKGFVQLHRGRAVHGPYLQPVRADWLKRLLEAQRWIRENGPEEVRELELVSLAELEEIRRIWLVDKHEVEDLLPGIYELALGAPYPGQACDRGIYGPEDMAVLREVCAGDDNLFEATRALLGVEQRMRNKQKRAGLIDALEKVLRRHQYANEDEATAAKLAEEQAKAEGQIALFKIKAPVVGTREAEKAIESLTAFLRRVGNVESELIAEVRVAIEQMKS